MSVSLGGYFKQLIYDSCEENGLSISQIRSRKGY